MQKQEKNPLQYVRENILRLKPYSTARDDFQGNTEAISTWLDANENPFDNRVNRYPDPHQRELKAVVAALKGVTPDMLFIGGSGSDEAIDLTFRIFCEPGRSNAVAIAPSYGVYQVAADVNDVAVKQVMLGEDYSLPVEKLLEATDADTRLMWICSPNNPTGNAFAREDILDLCRRFDGMVVVDEAYVDFSTLGSMVDFIAECPNLIVLQTFSKAWGMAGLRLGMAIADPRVAELFARVKYPYNVNGPTQREVISRIEGTDIRRMVDTLVAERGRLAAALEKTPGVQRVYPSDANFLLVRFDDPESVFKMLMENGVIVRNRNTTPGCEGCLRITVGTPEENSRVISLLNPGNEVADDTSRSAAISRATSETKIDCRVNLDGVGESEVSTGLKFFDHMLWQLPHHAGISMTLRCDGDLEVDEHHTMEDVAIALGDALREALADKRGIGRYGFVLPMDDCRAMVLMDLGGRVDFDWDVPFTREYVGDTPTEMYSHFFKTLATAMRCNLHVKAVGENNHHLIEAVFKGFARALRMAVERRPFCYDLPSSKGML